MKFRTVVPLFLGVLAPFALSACVTGVPDMHQLGKTPADEAARQGNLISHIKCELQQAAMHILNAPPPSTGPEPVSIEWLRNWGALASLKLAVNEKSGFTPGFSFNNPMRNVIKTFPTGGNVTVAQSQTSALAGSFTSEATRTEQIGFFYSFADLLNEKPLNCDYADGQLIEGDLRIEEFMLSKIVAAMVPGLLRASKPNASPFSTFTYEVSFVVTSGGSATPTWKLEYVGINPTGTFVNASRMRTSGLILTFGPVRDDAAGQEARDQHLADLIGRAVNRGE